MKFRIIAVVMALVLCFGILCACDNNDGDDKEVVTGSKYTGTGETLDLPEVEIPTDAGDVKSAMDKFYEEQYADMTPEEIAQFEQDLVDLGMTKEEFYSLMYMQEGDGGMVTAGTTEPEATTAAATTTTAATTAEKVLTVKAYSKLTFTGTLTSEYYEINSMNNGTVYILNLNEPVKCKLYDDFNGFDGTEKVIDSVQVGIDDADYAAHKGKTVTITGSAIVAHTGHHQRLIVLTDCVIG